MILRPSSNNDNNGNDDAGDGEPTDAVLVQLGGSQKHSRKSASNVEPRATWLRIVPKWVATAAATTMAATVKAATKTEVASKAIATSVANLVT